MEEEYRREPDTTEYIDRTEAAYQSAASDDAAFGSGGIQNAAPEEVYTGEDNDGYEAGELPSQDEILRSRIEERKRIQRKKAVRRKRTTLVIIILIIAVMLTLCGRQIIRLKAENHALKKEQSQLTGQRDDLKKELGNSNKKDYIKDKARQQLRLLNPGEILFMFGEEEEEGKDAD